MTTITPTSERSSFVWLFFDTLAVTKRHILKITRVPESLFFSLIQPVMFVLLFAFVFGGAINVGPGGAQSYREYLIPGIFAQTVMFATAGITVAISYDAQLGIMDRFRSLPMSPGAVLGGHTLANLVQNILVLGVLSITGYALGWRIHGSLADAVTAYVLMGLFAYAVTWIGAWVGLKMPNPEVASTAGLAWLFPLTFASNIFTPVSTMPGWLQPIALWNPVSCIALSARKLFGNPTPGLGNTFPETHTVLLTFIYAVVIVAVFAPLAVRAFKQNSSGGKA